MKIGSTFNHEAYGPLKITGKRYSRMGNKSLWIGTDEQGETHELDGTEKPAKPEKASPKFLKEAAEMFGMTQGPQGDKGIDADEEAIIQAVIPQVLERIQLPENGKDGADADTELIVRELLPLVTAQMPKPKELDEIAVIGKIMARIRIPQDGKNGSNGKDGSPDAPSEIKEKLESLKGDDRLDARAIKNLPKTQVGGGHGPNSLKHLEDVIITNPTNNQSLTYQSSTGKWVNSNVSGGGGGTVDTIVAGNNIDVDATDPANPIVSVETLTLADISDVTASITEVNYIDGVTSAIQTQLDGKFTLQAANVVNESGADVDQRFEGDTDQNLLFLDASTDKIGIGTATPAEKLEVNGNIKMTASGAVFNHVDTGKINISGVNVGINEGNPTQKLVVNGVIRVYTGGSGYYLADRGGTSDEVFYQIQSGGSNKWSLGMLGDATQNFRLYNNVLGATALSIASADSVATFAADVNVPDEAYGVGWNGSLEVPTKNAIYDAFTAGGVGDIWVEKAGDTMTGALVIGLAGNNLTLRNTTDSASVQVAILEGDRATMADNDEAYISLRLSDDGGTQTEVSRLTWVATDVNAGTNVDGAIDFSVMTAGSLAKEMRLNGASLTPSSDDGLTLGVGGAGWSDLFLASGAVINFNNGNYTITHSSGLLTLNGALSIGTSNALTVGTIELGHASANTLSASGGVLSIEGVVIPTISSTNTLTNKRRTRRLTTTNAPGATPTTNTDNVDIMNFTGLGTAITSMTTNLSGTPVDGDLLEFRFTDDGTARGITWGASFAATTVALPTTTVISTMLRVGFEYSGSTWKCIATC